MATAAIGKPEALSTALCSGGERVRVKFERRQPVGLDFNGRQWPGTFSSVAGVIFQIVDGNVSADATCFLASDELLAGATLVPLKRAAPDARCSQGRYPTFQADKNRPVVACWPLAESPSGIQVAIIEFARRLSQALASLVVIDGERRLYLDYPAHFQGPGADLWRADDGGEIHAVGFNIVLLMRRGPAYLLAIDWRGAEGCALSLWSAEEGDRFKELLHDSWYRSPL